MFPFLKSTLFKNLAFKFNKVPNFNYIWGAMNFSRCRTRIEISVKKVYEMDSHLVAFETLVKVYVRGLCVGKLYEVLFPLAVLYDGPSIPPRKLP